MANTFSTTTTTSFGSRIIKSIIGIPIGLALIFGSIIFLYWNEGHYDLSKLAKKTTVVSPAALDSSQNGKPISVTGQITSDQTLGDTYLQPGNYIYLKRTVEEFAWHESQQNQSHNNLGGSQTNTTTYTYDERWDENPQSSTTFKQPAGHENPAKTIPNNLAAANQAAVGAYKVNPASMKMPDLSNLSLTSDMVVPSATPPAVLASTQYLFSGSGSLATPNVGDERLSFQVLPAGTEVTAFGILHGGEIQSYSDHGHILYNLMNGDRNTAIARLHTDYLTEIWLLRGLGVLALWIGLMMLAGPIDTILSFLPAAGTIGRGLIGLLTLPIALVVGGTTIIVGYVAHRPVFLIIAVVIAFFVGAFLVRKIHGKPV